MTTTPSFEHEIKDLQENKIRFPYDISNELLEHLRDTLEGGWELLRVRHELMIREQGRSLVAVALEDEHGNAVIKDGKAQPQFVYTLGQGRKGFPEILCFFPSAYIGHCINALCDKMESGEAKSDEDGTYLVGGCFPQNPELDFILIPLEGSQRQLAAEKYACQCEDDEPLLLAVAPYSDGTPCTDFIPEGFH